MGKGLGLLANNRAGGNMRVGSLVTSRYHYSMGVVLLVDTHWGDEWAHVKWLDDTNLDPIQYLRDLEVLCE